MTYRTMIQYPSGKWEIPYWGPDYLEASDAMEARYLYAKVASVQELRYTDGIPYWRDVAGVWK